MSRRTAVRVIWFVILTALIAGSIAPGAAAQPADPPAESTVTITWPDLGLPAGVTFVSTNIAQEYTVPVPMGLSPLRLRGVIRAPVNLGAGYLEISDAQERFLAAINLPDVRPDQAAIPFDVDISSAYLTDSSVKLRFTVRQVDGTGRICGPTQQLAITELATVYSGRDPAPNTIATFFPAVLRQVTIYAPADADMPERETVLTLVSALTRLYTPQRVAVRVVEQRRGTVPPAAGQLSRTLVVERADKPGISVVNPDRPDAYLRLSGRGDELIAQTSLLVNQIQSLAQVPSARVDQPGARRAFATDTLTFSQLKMSGKTDVLATGYLTVSVDRAALGIGRVDAVQVHLLADYTPVAKEDLATMMVRANGVVVYSQSLDNSGHIDATFELTRQMLTQRVSLDFVFTYTPHLACSAMTAPLTFQVDPRSTLTVRRGGKALGGFRSLPAEFSPTFMVALDGSGPNQLDYAARVIAGLARQTSAALTPHVVDMDTAASAGSGALIVANAESVEKTPLDPPLAGQGSSVHVGLPAELRAEISGGLGSIQAFADTSRNRTVVLVTTMGDWKLVDPLLGYIDRLEGGWSSLTGDVLAVGKGGAPTNVTIREDGSQFVPPQPEAWKKWVAISAGCAVALVVGAVGIWLWRRFRRGSASASS